MNILQTIGADASALWKKLVGIWNGTVKPELTIAEQEVLAILQPLFGTLEADALQDVIVFAKGVLAANPTSNTVSGWTTVIIQLAEVAGGSLWTSIQSLSVQALEALVNLVIADLLAAQAAKAASQAKPLVSAELKPAVA